MTRPYRLPHPLILLLAGVAVAAALTWIVPAGDFDRRDDPSTGRRIVVAGTYHRVPQTPRGVFAAAVSVPRGFVAAADVIAVVLFVGGAWVVVDRLGALPALVAFLVRRFHGRGLWAIPVISLFFAVMGALENMQEEIIPLVPALLVPGSDLRPLEESLSPAVTSVPAGDLRPRHVLILILALAPMGVYVYGALRLEWGFNELSGAFLIAGIAAGMVGGLGAAGTLTAYLE